MENGSPIILYIKENTAIEFTRIEGSQNSISVGIIDKDHGKNRWYNLNFRQTRVNRFQDDCSEKSPFMGGSEDGVYRSNNGDPSIILSRRGLVHTPPLVEGGYTIDVDNDEFIVASPCRHTNPQEIINKIRYLIGNGNLPFVCQSLDYDQSIQGHQIIIILGNNRSLKQWVDLIANDVDQKDKDVDCIAWLIQARLVDTLSGNVLLNGTIESLKTLHNQPMSFAIYLKSVSLVLALAGLFFIYVSDRQIYCSNGNF